MPSLPLVLELNDGQYPLTVFLSPSSMTLIMAGLTILEDMREWQGANDNPLTETETDEVKAMVDNLARELMMPMVGQVLIVAGALPGNCLECDGATYDKSTNPEYARLYDILDAAFIIDADSFSVPDLRGSVVLGSSASYPIGQTGGEATHVLSIAELPSHGHTDTGHTHTEITATPTVVTIGAGAPVPSAIPGVGVTGAGSANIANTGGDAAHENLPPYTALRYVIVAF